MSDLDLVVAISRGLIGLSTLELNDHTTYYVASQMLGAQVQYNRVQATSPWVDGAHTVARTKQMVTEQIAIEVRADTATALQTAMADLITAFSQDSFTLGIAIDGATYHYLCEAADYQVSWTTPRMVARQAQIVFSVPRQPNALVGAV